MKHINNFILINIVTLMISGVFAQSSQQLFSVNALDVSRYMGRWYEIAKYPNWFQKKCASNTMANYSLLLNGQVKVSNQCRLVDGEVDTAVGIARQIGERTSAKLKVSFTPEWLSVLPFVWGDYWVIDLDPEYSLVAVSEPSREYLWILSRNPEVDQKRYADLLIRLQSMNFDVSKLEVTRH